MSTMADDTSVRKKLYYYCGHCKEEISKTLFFQHKRRYYDSDRNMGERH